MQRLLTKLLFSCEKVRASCSDYSDQPATARVSVQELSADVIFLILRVESNRGIAPLFVKQLVKQ